MFRYILAVIFLVPLQLLYSRPTDHPTRQVLPHPICPIRLLEFRAFPVCQLSQ